MRGADSEFNNLVKGGGKSVEAFKAIGATARNADGSMRPLLDIIPDMQEKMAQLGAGDRQIIMQALFGVEGGNAMNALLGTTTERIDQMRQGVDEAVQSQRSLGDSKAMMDNLTGSWQTLTGSIETASVQYGMFLEQGVRPMIDGATKLINTFTGLPPVYQKALMAVGTFAGVLATATAAIAAYNIAKTTQVAIEIKSAAATVASSLSLQGLALSAAVAGDAVLAFTAKAGVLIFRMAAFIAIFEAGRRALQGFSDQSEVSKVGNSLRDRLKELELQGGKTAKVFGELNVEKSKLEARPKRADIFDFFNIRGRRLAEDYKVAVREFGIAMGDLDAQLKNQNDKERSDLLNRTQADLNAKLAALNDAKEQIGTDAYDESFASLQLAQTELTRMAKTYGVEIKSASDQGTQAIEETVKATEEVAKATQKQTETIDAQIEAQQKLNEAKKQGEQQVFEDQTAAINRQADSDRQARQEANQKKLQEREALFTSQLDEQKQIFETKLQDQKEARDRQLLIEKRAQEDSDRAEQKSFDEARRADQEAFDKEQNRLKVTAQKAEEFTKTQFEKQKQADEKTFNESQQTEEKAFVQSLEVEKDNAAKARQAAERALADEISARLEQQVASFSEAGRQLSEQEKILSAQSEEERQKLIAEFEARRQQEAKVAALDLANQIYSPDQLIATAQEVSGITSIKTAEDAQKLQQALALIESEQKRQQAEADAAAKEALQQKLQADQVAFETELQAKKEAFELKQQAAQDAFELKQQTARDAFETQMEARKQQFEAQLNLTKQQFEDQQAAIKEQRELALIDRARQREDQARIEADAFETQQQAKRLVFEEQVRAVQKQFDDQQKALDKQFNDSERLAQQNFEDMMRDRQRQFNEAQRKADEESAAKIAALKSSGSTAPVTEVTPRFAGGDVLPGQLYLGGERNPEPIVFPDGKMGMVGVHGAELFRVPQKGVVYPSMSAMLASGDPRVVAELQGIRGDLNGRAVSLGNQTYNIVTQENPLAATIKLQQESIRMRAKLAKM